jgi:hypothetical protein
MKQAVATADERDKLAALVADFDAHLRTLVDGAAECTRNEYESGTAHGMQSILDHWEQLRSTTT